MPDKSDKPSTKSIMPSEIIGEITKIQSPLPGDHPYFALIGRVASEWTHFERVLDEIIRDIGDLPEDIALCITGQIMGAAPRYKAIEALGKHIGLSASTIKKVRQLKNNTFEVAEKRNRIVHDPWFQVLEFEEESETEKITQLRSSPPGEKPVSEADVEITIKQIRACVREAALLHADIQQELHTLQNKLT